MVSVALGDMNASKMQIWSKHPLGKGIIFKVLKHFESIGDIQQVAMIAALIFGKERSIHSQQSEKIEQQRREQIEREKRQQDHYLRLKARRD